MIWAVKHLSSILCHHVVSLPYWNLKLALICIQAESMPLLTFRISTLRGCTPLLWGFWLEVLQPVSLGVVCSHMGYWSGGGTVVGKKTMLLLWHDLRFWREIVFLLQHCQTQNIMSLFFPLFELLGRASLFLLGSQFWRLITWEWRGILKEAEAKILRKYYP